MLWHSDGSLVSTGDKYLAVEVTWGKVPRVSDIPLQRGDKTAYINGRIYALVTIQKATPSGA